MHMFGRQWTYVVFPAQSCQGMSIIFFYNNGKTYFSSAIGFTYLDEGWVKNEWGVSKKQGKKEYKLRTGWKSTTEK